MSLPDFDIFTEFQKVPQASRHDFLTRLSSHFYPSDWHHLHCLITAHSGYIDLLTALPIELSLNVLQYLPPVQTILLRAVSRGYYNLLTSPETCRFLSNHFFPLSNTPADSCRIHYENLVSRRLSFRRGRPTRFEEIPGGGSVVSFCASTSTLASVVGDTLRVHLLTTTPPTLLLPPKRTSDRAQPIFSALTPVIVAVVSNTRNCQVWDLSTHATHTVRLPSAPSAIYGSGYTIAMTIRSDLLVYDASLKKTNFFAGVFQWRPMSLIVHEPTRRIWVISFDLGKEETTVMALCLDTAAVVVSAKVFPQLVAGRLFDVGSGIWKMGRWKWESDGFTAVQLRIDVGSTTEAVQVQVYPHIPHWVVPPVMNAGDWETDRSVVVWEDVSWACLSERLRFAWERSAGWTKGVHIGFKNYCATEVLRNWWWYAVCEKFLVVENAFQDLGIFRFEGVHEQLAEATMLDVSNERWIGGSPVRLGSLEI